MPITLPTVPMIGADERFNVSSQRYEIMFRDGSAIGLHQVWQGGAPMLLLRALRFGVTFFVFDLAKVHRELANDLPMTHTRDVPGTVFYALRSKFGTADELLAAALKARRAWVMPSTQAGAANDAGVIAA